MMENNLKISKKNILFLFIVSLLFVIIHNLKIDWYIKDVIVPFSLLILSYLMILKNEKELNKKAYLFLIPLVLILISDFLFRLDKSNMMLNIVIIPILISILFFSLTNKNYNISLKNTMWIFKLFPNRLFENLKYLNLRVPKEKSRQVDNVIIGIIIGSFIGVIILLLLMSADAYFESFISNILTSLNVKYENILLLFITFMILFSVLVNILLNRNIEVEEKKYIKVDEIIVTTVLIIINTIFVLFLFSEISKLTINFLRLPVEYTYASYAREGFFQLLFVTMINFIIIMYLLYKTKIIDENSKIKKLIFILITFSIILIFNSYYRMYLYINHFGFTVLRLQVLLFLTMEFIIFIVLIKKLFRGLKHNNALIYFIVMISFYIVNLYLCNETVIYFLN